MNREEIFQNLQNILLDNFEIDPARITLEASLYEDLDLDSIDAVDLVIHVQELVGKKVGPDAFRQARTVSDVIDIVVDLLAAEG
jgi:acyl carrier protein